MMTLPLLENFCTLILLLFATSASSQPYPNCSGTTKQPAIYAHFNFSTPLDISPAFELNSTVEFVNTRDVTRGGVFGSNMLHWGHGNGTESFGGGYTGFQSTGPESASAQLFSVWDGETKVWPAHDNCKRHMNDGRAMGTQCSANSTFPDGHHVRFHVWRTAINSTVQINASFSVQGDIWQSDATDITEGAAPLTVGAMVFEGGWGGIDDYSFFFEHFACIPCDAWRAEVAFVESPSFDGRTVDTATITINGYNTSECKSQTVTACLDGVGCGKPIVHFLTGPGIVRNITDGQQLW